ncbi:MAG: carbohydrate kinase [Verrucomicrobiae bacterium]|nr:carbohydrate kinase [Verrucomicrobiae bacterium]
MRSCPIVVGLGEILWDIFPNARHFGGAPANVAAHARELGAQGAIASAVGRDPLGREAREVMSARNLDTSAVFDSDYPTGTVTVRLDAAGKASYEFAPDTAWDHLRWTDELATLAARADAVVFGTLGQRNAVSRETIHRFLAATRPDCMRVFDVNLRQNFHNPEIIDASLQFADVLKLNDEELPIVFPGADESALQALAAKHKLSLIALTRGGDGAVLTAATELSDLPGVTVEITDTVGAGDSFTAATILGLLARRPLAEINRHASAVAAYVCSQPGATPRLPENLRNLFQ